MSRVVFNKILGLREIVKNFGGSEGDVRTLLGLPDKSLLYEELKIPKKNRRQRGNFRTVYSPTPWLSQIQKNIAVAVEESSSFLPCVQGFIKGSSPRKNAELHLAKKLLLNADIKDFFDNITILQVKKVFLGIGCNTDVAEALSEICTIGGFLRQGLPSSPIIANLVALDLDTEFTSLSDKHNCTYSRYADDMTFSSDTRVPSKEDIMKILSSSGFSLNEKKFRLQKRGQAQFVTGLSVFDSDHPRVPKRIKRNLRLELFYIQKYGLEGHLVRKEVPSWVVNFEYKSIKGKVDYINAVEPLLAQKIYAIFRAEDIFQKPTEEEIMSVIETLVGKETAMQYRRY